MTELPDPKLPIRASKGSHRKNLTRGAWGDRVDKARMGAVDTDLILERFERAQLAEDATRHLRVPSKIKLG